MYRLSWNGRAALAALAIVLLLAVSTSTATASTGCHYDPALRQWVCQAANSPDPSPKAGPKPATGPGLCSWQGRVYPCHDPAFGWLDTQSGCYFLSMTPQPTYDSKLWEGHPDGQGAIYQFMCPTWVGLGGGWRWRATSPQPARAAVGPVWAQVTVTPVALTFAPGDAGSTASCSGPGKVWTPQAGQWAHAPGGCDYSYPQSTFGYPGGQLTATYGIVWRAVWVGSGGTGGTFPDVTTTATSRFAVAEAQAVIVK
jgi:hypothetical protein